MNTYQSYLADHDDLPLVGTVTPDLVLVEGETAYSGPKPLKWALEHLPRGRVTVVAGEYRVGRLAKPVVGHHLAGGPGSIITGEGEDDAIFFAAPPIAPVLLEGMTIIPGRRSGIATHDDGQPGTRYRIDLDLCRIDGGYDHAENTGREAKWGMIPHRWAGYVRRTTIRDIKREHGIYAHTAAGDIYLDKCRIYRCGRTAVQHVGREHESGFSPYTLRITDTTIDDCGLWDGGAHITAQGIRRVMLRRVRSRIGFDPQFVAAYLESHPGVSRFGRNHLVNWSEITDHTPNENKPSEGVWLDDYAAITAPGCGSGPAVSVTNARTLALSGQVVIESGSEFEPALKTTAAMDFAGLRGLSLNMSSAA